MLAMNGNTATYMQYAYAPGAGHLPQAEDRHGGPPGRRYDDRLGTPAERALGLELLRFGEALDLAAADYRPNH